MHYRDGSGREQDSTTQGWLESQVEIGKELKREGGQSPAEQGQSGIQAGCWDSITQRDFSSNSQWKGLQLPTVCMLCVSLY